MVIAILMLGIFEEQTFIYFQFWYEICPPFIFEIGFVKL